MFTPISINNTPKKTVARNSNKSSSSDADKTEVVSFSETLESELIKQTTNQTTDTEPTSSIGITNSKLSGDEITDLISTLENHGQALAGLPSLENFHQYRKSLQRVIKKIVPQAIALEKEYSLNTANLTQKEFHLIFSVNKELDSLLKMIVSNHQKHFTIANKVVSIKGLVVNFLL